MKATKWLESCKGHTYIEYFIAAAAMSVATGAILASLTGEISGGMFGGWWEEFFQP